jgi:hypothetical protein
MRKGNDFSAFQMIQFAIGEMLEIVSSINPTVIDCRRKQFE